MYQYDAAFIIWQKDMDSVKRHVNLVS